MTTFSIRPATHEDLNAINLIISSAVMNWPIANRLKRLAADPLHYDDIDLQHMKIIAGGLHGHVTSVAARDSNAKSVSKQKGSTTFRGLYILPLLQRQGLGLRLLDAIFESAYQLGLRGVLVKAQRISCGYFEHHGLQRLKVSKNEYPWQYWKHLDGNQHV